MSRRIQRQPFDDIANVVPPDVEEEELPVAQKEEGVTHELRRILRKFTKEELLREVRDIIGGFTHSDHLNRNQLIEQLAKQARSRKYVDLYIFNLNRDLSTSSLQELFENYGKVRGCFVEDGQGIVRMSPIEGARTVVQEMHNLEFRGQTIAVQLSANVFLYNLPKGTRSEEIQAMLSEYGDVRDCYTGRSYGFAHILSEDAASAAVSALHGTVFKGHTLSVEKEEEKNVETCLTELELRYCQLHPQARQWTALEIKRPSALVDVSTSPEQFAKKFEKCLKRTWLTCTVSSRFCEDRLWSMISIKKMKQKPDRVFIVSFPRIPIIAYANLRVNYRDDVHRALVHLFGGTGKELFTMKSKNVNNLMVLSCTKAGVEENVPEVAPPKRVREKRRLREEGEEEEEAPVEELYPNVINEDKDEETERQRYLQKVFTDKQPPMEKLTYDASSDFFGLSRKHPPIPVVCRAVFKGDNIAEGIKQLVRSGVMQYPLPNHITDVPKKYCNNFRLKVSSGNQR